MGDNVLYEDDSVRISYLKDLVDEHVVSLCLRDWMGVMPHDFYLQRGVLEELAKTENNLLRNKLNAIVPAINYFLEKSGLSYERMGLALAQARIRELEQELTESYASEQKG